MFERLISKELKKWSSRQDRKPLILRGARQVGKTTLVQQFAKEFNLFINLNLEKNEHRLLFEKNYSINELVSAIFYLEGKPRNLKKTLLFIDEIQNSPEAISSLRYFYEEIPELYVIAAGSLLETLLSRGISFPVGRVEYLAIRPCAFVEFLA
ncbi:MAG TPA: ATPase, partial [Bacteroidales bacterium]|nr:ATPase [Bacteroidales bacterium]